MGKRLAAILTVLLLWLCLCGAASAEIFVLDEIFASVDIPDTFPVVLRPGYLDSFSTWLEARGKTGGGSPAGHGRARRSAAMLERGRRPLL